MGALMSYEVLGEVFNIYGTGDCTGTPTTASQPGVCISALASGVTQWYKQLGITSDASKRSISVLVVAVSVIVSLLFV